MNALNFVLKHGDEFPNSEDCDAWTMTFSESLLAFGDAAAPYWHTETDYQKFRYAYTLAAAMLIELLPDLNKRLDQAGRFGWRIELTRLLLGYMQERFGYDSSLRPLVDHYVLVNRAIFYFPN